MGDYTPSSPSFMSSFFSAYMYLISASSTFQINTFHVYNDGDRAADSAVLDGNTITGFGLPVYMYLCIYVNIYKCIYIYMYTHVCIRSRRYITSMTLVGLNE